MRVMLTISGGLAPRMMGRQLVVDSTNLSQADRDALDRAVVAASAAPAVEPNPRARDARSYEITIESGSASKTLMAEDGAVPEAVRKLIDLMKAFDG